MECGDRKMLDRTMRRVVARFIDDEDGAASVDGVVVIGGALWMCFSVMADVSAATLDLGKDINNRIEYSQVLNEILKSHGPGGTGQSAPEASPGTAPSGEGGGSAGGGGGSTGGGGGGSGGGGGGAGNPGNDKAVGNAGENPNGRGGWGSGSHGRSK